jgi:hypothetical protein
MPGFPARTATLLDVARRSWLWVLQSWRSDHDPAHLPPEVAELTNAYMAGLRDVIEVL